MLFNNLNFQPQTNRSSADYQSVVGWFQDATQQWLTWEKPKNKSFLLITCIGAGGNGGTGVIGANSTAAGGGGGGSGSYTRAIFNLVQLPDTLYYSVPGQGSALNMRTVVALEPVESVTTNLIYATRGGNGGNASGATAGTGGTAGAAAANTGAYMIGMHSILAPFYIAGTAGSNGGTTAAGSNANFPNTGIPVCPGTGGAGLPAAATNGSSGGVIFVATASRWFQTLSGGTSGSSTTTPPGNGRNGEVYDNEQVFNFYGGTGGGSTHGSAVGAGLVQSSGGNGSIGSGGGGSGGALTGSTPGIAGLGGPGLIIFQAF